MAFALTLALRSVVYARICDDMEQMMMMISNPNIFFFFSLWFYGGGHGLLYITLARMITRQENEALTFRMDTGAAPGRRLLCFKHYPVSKCMVNMYLYAT